MLRFLRHIRGMPPFWQVWIAALGLTNMAAVLFLPRVEAVVVLGGLALGGLFQNLLFARFGFVRLLGLGHFHWFPMVAWLFHRLASIPAGSVFKGWVIAVIAVCSLSLVIDVVDVIRYLRGEREPTVALHPARA